MDKLDHHQQAVVKRILNTQKQFIWWRPGLGKTRIALMAFASVAKSRSTFFYVCRRAAFNDVRDEVQELGLDWHVSEFGNGAIFNMKKRAITLILISNGLLARHLDTLLSIPFRISGMTLDEGFLYKNPKSQITKAANKLSQGINMVLMLSGSIMTAGNIEDLFGQAFAMNEQDRIGRTLTNFRSLFMLSYSLSLKDEGREFLKYAPKRGALKQIVTRLRPITSIRFSKHEQIIRRIVKHVEPTPIQRKLIATLAKDYYVEYKGLPVECRSPLAITIRAQQIANGYLSNGKGNRVSVPTNKIETLKGIVQELHAEGERCAIWCAFRHDLEVLEAALPMEIATVASGVSSSYLKSISSSRVVAITEAYGSSFNILAQFPYAIYFSQNHKWLDLQQSMHRHLRKNSRHNTVFYYFLLVKGSLDGLVYKAAQDSKRKEKELINMMEIRKWVDS